MTDYRRGEVKLPASDDQLRREVEELKKRIEKLEKELREMSLAVLYDVKISN